MKTKVIRTATIVVLLVVSLILPVQAAPLAQGPSPGGMTTPELIQAALERGDIDQDTANLYLAYALGDLDDYDKLPPEYHSNVPWDGTPILLHLQQAVNTMDISAQREEIIKALSGSCGSQSGAGQTNTDNTSANFHIQYGTIGGGLTLANYRTSLDNTWTTEVTNFGWAAPPVSSNPPPGNRYHVLIAPLGGGLYGFVSRNGTHTGWADSDGASGNPADGDNPDTAWNETTARVTCMVLNNDYSGSGDAQKVLDAATGHEFHHTLQFGYGAIGTASDPDINFVEGSATWIEDEVNDGSNDNYGFLWPQFAKCMGEYPSGGIQEYSFWLTFRGLTERYGTTVAGGSEQVMQNYWEEVSKGNGSMLTPLNASLVVSGTNLADAYHAYAIAAKFMKTCAGGYVYPYCFEEAAGYIGAKGSAPAVQGTIGAVENSYRGGVEDNYALNWVALPTGTTAYTVTLQNTSAGGQLRGTVVCDTGAALNINPLPAVATTGISTTLTNFDPTGCTSVVAVVTNQSQIADNPTSCTSRSYKLSAYISSISQKIYLPFVVKGY